MITKRQLLASMAALGLEPAAAQFRVEVAGVGGTQIPIAVANLRDEHQAGAAVAAIVRGDLARSGVFNLLDAPGTLDERSSTPEAQRTRGADALVAGSAARLADGRIDLRYKLWELPSGTELLAQSLAVHPADVRLAAHRMADAVYQRLTGEAGVFATRVAYISKQGSRYALMVADADGENAQAAVADNEPLISPAWAPDGRELAYVSFNRQKAEVWVQELASGRRRVLASFKGSNSAPAWSPDGRELAVTLSRDAPAQLYVLPREGGTPRRLTTSAGIDTEPCWAPDGKTIYFVSDRGGGPQIYRVPSAGGQAERLTFSGSYNISPAISPDGRLLAYINRQGNVFRVATLDLANSNARLVSDGPDDESPSFAPNGKLIMYAARSNGRDLLMTTTLDGRIKTRLLSSTADLREPAWGPFQR